MLKKRKIPWVRLHVAGLTDGLASWQRVDLMGLWFLTRVVNFVWIVGVCMNFVIGEGEHRNLRYTHFARVSQIENLR